MRHHRFWIEIVVLGTLVACILALLIATVGAAAGAASDENVTGQQTQAQPAPNEGPHGQEVFQGMVTCSRCGARHPAALDRSASNCVRTCVHAGSSFALIEDESIYILQGDAILLKKLAGQRAEIVGTRSGQVIHVSSASAKS
ncbi:MAG TPA: hypothetical protein VGS27_15615 [Candidatus Sulfotelmatobacter sp.]|nr:hypothetical protein [Candidatus Sulfotelmatobacter sp.]